MANSYTTTYSLTKPEVGAAEDQWGDLLNANLDAIDDLLDGTTAVTGIDINSGTIDGVTIGGTAAPTVTNIDINGGTIDGTVIGGASAAAVTATALTATSSATLQHSASTKLATTSTGVDVTGTVTADGLTVDGTIASPPVIRISNDGGNWVPDDEIGRLQFYTTDPSGIGAREVASIRAISEITNTTPGGALHFYRSGSNSNVTKAMEITRSGDISFYEDTGTTSKFFFDASTGYVGINDSSPNYPLDINSGATAVYDPSTNYEEAGLQIESTAGVSGSGAFLKLRARNGSGQQTFWNIGAVSKSANLVSNLVFQARTGTTTYAERMRIDASGNVLVGTTSSDPSAHSNNVTGTAIGASGYISMTRDGAVPVFINRKTSDGNIAEFRKDGTTVGSIGVSSTTGLEYMYIGSGAVGLLFDEYGADGIRPFNTNGTLRDNAIDLGSTAARFDDIYATNGTIQTSDANEKQQIAELTAAEMEAAKAISKLFKTFKWNDSVAEKGDDARIHSGVIAQEVEAAMTAAGLDAGRYAFFISSTWWESTEVIPAVEAVEAVEAVYEDVIIPAVLDEEGNEIEPERTEQRLVSEAIEAVEAQPERTVTHTHETAEEAPIGAVERTRKGIRYPQLLSFIGAATEQRLASIEARLDAAGM